MNNGAENARPQGARILIIEDDPDSRVSLQELLQLWGYRVSAAADGADGIKAALSENPEVILVDIGIPGPDGYEVARRLTDGGAQPRPVLVALTGWARDEDRKRGLQAGFDAYLAKPVDADELREILEFALRKGDGVDKPEDDNNKD